MGKIDDNKHQKEEALLQSADRLFLSQGIDKTSIHDIVKEAGVAKGTFYLYFKDKYEIRDRLIALRAARLFAAAHAARKKQKLHSFEDKVVFIIDYILEQLRKDQTVLRFISKNLSWGIFRHALAYNNPEDEVDVEQSFNDMLTETPNIQLRASETMFFLIAELASAASFSTILDNAPVSFEELKPYLEDSIRAIIRNHIIIT